MKRALFLVFPLILASFACSFVSPSQPLSLTVPATATVLPDSPPIQTTASIPSPALPPAAVETIHAAGTLEKILSATSSPAQASLSVEQIRNASFILIDSDQVRQNVILQDGQFQNEVHPDQAGYINLTLMDKIAFGDLNGDGLEDAAVIMVENFGGSGQFASLATFLNQNGKPRLAARTMIDDRPIFQDIAIKDGAILLNVTVHGPNDPMCCPNQPTVRVYRLLDQDLQIVRYSSTTSSGSSRIIQINDPADGSEFSSPFTVRGSTTISPFENTLSYAIFKNGVSEPILKAGFTVQTSEPGGPGTFILPLDLTQINYHGQIRIEITDFSLADGSILARDSIFVLLK